MAMVYESASKSYLETLDDINFFFSIVFLVECIMKFIAFGVGGYLQSNWRNFDLFVVICSIIDYIMVSFGDSDIKVLTVGPQLARIFRVLRVTRLLKLVKSMRGL